MAGLTHFDAKGDAVMVDVAAKPVTERVAVAGGSIVMRPETLARIRVGQIAKGDVLAVARLAGIMAAKKTGDLIPLCHPIGLDAVSLDFALDEARSAVDITATCKVHGRTGVEMEAMCAVSVAALTIYDMCKAIDRGMHIGEVRLLRKSGGKSGDFEPACSRATRRAGASWPSVAASASRKPRCWKPRAGCWQTTSAPA